MLTVDDIKHWTSKVNRYPGFAQNDYLVAKAFAEPVDSCTHYRRVILLDTLFSANLRRGPTVHNRQRKEPFQISEDIRACLPRLNQIVVPILQGGLFQLDLTDQQVNDSISEALQTVLSCLNNHNMSFTGKYLHFVFPNVFPLWDKYVRQAINRIYRRAIFPDNGANTSHYYLLLCQKYKEIIARFTDTEIQAIRQHDAESLPQD